MYPFTSGINAGTDVGRELGIKKEFNVRNTIHLSNTTFLVTTESPSFKVTFQNIRQIQAHFQSNMNHVHHSIPSCHMWLRILDASFRELMILLELGHLTQK